MPKLLRSALTLVLLTLCSSSLIAQSNLWQDVKESSFTRTASQKRMIEPAGFRALKLNTSALLVALQQAPLEFTEAAKTNPLILSLPMPDGGYASFAVVSSPMMEPALQAQFPNIRTYSGQGIDDPTATLKMDWTEFGFHAQIRSANNDKGFYIDPYVQGETTQYISYLKKDLPVKNHIETGVLDEQMDNLGGLSQKTDAGPCIGNQLKSYRLAVACTGEYAVAVGASTVAQALSAITTTVNRVNGIFETELAIRLTLVGNNSSIVFIDATTDPFTGNNNASTLINESQTVIDANITSPNYDVGHTFSTGAGGLAQNPAVCWSGSKARGVTGSTNPTGDAYDVDFVAHEMGHQFGGSHSFNAITGGCNGNRNGSTSVEPGSGVTIMGYAGLCTTNNLSPNSIPYFHATSQNQVWNLITTHPISSTCGTVINTGNAIPVVNAGADYTIPASTPFMLTGSATDANNSEVLTYSWEEIDNGVAGDWNYGGTPFFRSFAPSLSKTRYFPKLSDVVNQTTTIGEFLPSTSQVLNFRLTVRDNRAQGGGICSDDVVVTVNASSGPFSVTSHVAPATLTANGSNTTLVTWSVASTNVAPVNTANVAILFSADGGQTFPYTLAASTANDGSESVLIPSVATSQGRIMVKAIGNIFFNISAANLTVNTACVAEGAVISPATTVTAVRGASALNLALSPQYATPFAPSGTLTTGDPASNLAVFSTVSSSCMTASNQMRYDQYTLNVSANGTYTFTLTAPFPTMMNLYLGSFDPANPCTNFVASNGSYNGATVSIGSTIAPSLSAGQVYVLVIGTFSSTQPPLPANYSVAVTPPAGGNAFSGSGAYVNPGGSFSYTYVVVNNATGNIVSIGNSNLTNATTYPPGQYTIYGLSYANTISNLGSYVGGSLNALLTQIQNNPTTFCASLSKNSVTVNVTGVLPVQFTSLKARKNQSKVDLNWGTLSEQNSSHFMVQRSASGSDFTEIGKVQAAGNSNTQKDYSFVDVSPLPGWNFYRLKQVDLDGKFMYSNTAAVNFDREGSLIVVYPNPAKDVLNVEYTSIRSGKLELQVIDSKGAVLMKQYMSVAVGMNTGSIDIASLSNGMYILRYQDADGKIAFTRFVKQ